MENEKRRDSGFASYALTNFRLLFAKFFDIIYPVTDYHRTMRAMKMKFSYNKLWKLLIDRGMLKKDLKEQAGIASTTLAKMGKGESVSMEVLWRICQTLNVNVGDIVEFIFPKK